MAAFRRRAGPARTCAAALSTVAGQFPTTTRFERVLGEGMAQGGSLLLGQRTYADFYGFWPNQKDNPFTEGINNIQKYVASTTLTEPLPWSNSTLLKAVPRRL